MTSASDGTIDSTASTQRLRLNGVLRRGSLMNREQPYAQATAGRQFIKQLHFHSVLTLKLSNLFPTHKPFHFWSAGYDLGLFGRLLVTQRTASIRQSKRERRFSPWNQLSLSLSLSFGRILHMNLLLWMLFSTNLVAFEYPPSPEAAS